MTYRELDAEEIRQEYINVTIGPLKESETQSLKGYGKFNHGSSENPIDPKVFEMAVHRSFFKQLSETQLSALFNAIMAEMRDRDLDTLKTDIITKSKTLSMGRAYRP